MNKDVIVTVTSAFHRMVDMQELGMNMKKESLLEILPFTRLLLPWKQFNVRSSPFFMLLLGEIKIH